MELELHPDAAANFNEKAKSLLLELAASPPLGPAQPPSSFQPDPFIAAHITDADILGEIRLGLVDYAGAEVGKHFVHMGRAIGLQGEGYTKLRQLSEGMHRTKGLREKVSTTLLTDLIFAWMRQQYEGTTSIPMVEYVLGTAAKAVQEQEIWIPISMLYIQSEFRLGRVMLKTITAELFSRWREDTKHSNPQHSEKIQEWFDREQKKLQGLAAATIRVHADPERAREIAFEEAEDAIGILRFFSPANHHPELVSYCIVLGKENRETTTSLTIRNGRLVGTRSGVVRKTSPQWVIDNHDLALFNSAGLEVLSRLLAADIRTPFQETLLDALRLYSKSSLAGDLADKLIYILVPLESIFVRNETESLQQNIAERVAFFMARTRNERRDIVRVVKQAYSMRSSFLHHGTGLEDMEALRTFMRMAWRCFSVLIQNADKFQTVEQLLSAIDDERLS